MYGIGIRIQTGFQTYSMVERLLRLKMYFAILQEEGDLDSNLTDQQWKIIADLKVLLQPFMITQKLLEGEAYVTISLVTYMIYKIRKDLINAVANELSSQHVVITGTRMLNKLNEIFGTGALGTVAVDNFEDGARRRPKGIPILTLIASFLDPRMKAGIGIPDLDKEYNWRALRDEAIRIAIQDSALEAPEEWAEQDGDADSAAEIENVVPNPPNPCQQLYDVMFDDINDNYLQEQQRMNNNNNNHINNNGAQRQETYQLTLERILQSADAEILLYRTESSFLFKMPKASFAVL
jgi:hypothetical protein